MKFIAEKRCQDTRRFAIAIGWQREEIPFSDEDGNSFACGVALWFWSIGFKSEVKQ